MIPPVAPGHIEEQNMVGWKNTFNMRQVTFMNLSSSQLGLKNGNRINNISAYKKSYSITSPEKSLDLLRKNLQSAINKDIDNVVKKYLDKFFQPAIVNIKNNLGKDSISEDHIKVVCRQMLEEAKLMYQVADSRNSSPYEYSDSEGSITECRSSHGSPLHGSKRKETDFDPDFSCGPGSKKGKLKMFYMTDYNNYKLPIKREGPKWNSDRITKNTLYIMGAKANKVLGYGQTRGRLYVRHPDLVRYSGDQEDKEWLASRNLMPPSGGKAYLMLLEDIKELTQSDDYKSSPNLQLHELQGFEVPPFLMQKIKHFIESVRTDKRPALVLDPMNYRGHSETPSSVSQDSRSSTPLETAHLIDCHSEGIGGKGDNKFASIAEINPNSNSSLQSAGFTSSPLTSSESLFSLNTMFMRDSSSPNDIKLNNLDNCLPNMLASHVISDSSQDF